MKRKINRELDVENERAREREIEITYKQLLI